MVSLVKSLEYRAIIVTHLLERLSSSAKSASSASTSSIRSWNKLHHLFGMSRHPPWVVGSLGPLGATLDDALPAQEEQLGGRHHRRHRGAQHKVPDALILPCVRPPKRPLAGLHVLTAETRRWLCYFRLLLDCAKCKLVSLGN